MLEHPDFLVIGAPCNPFSVQRPGRFEDTSVEGHSLFGLTFDGVIGVLQKFSPVSAVMETTDGFCKPTSKNMVTTPLLQFPGCSCFLSC